MRMRILAALMLVLCTAGAAAQNSGGRTLDLVFTVKDLRFTVDDLVGVTQNLQIKETPTEIQIQLQADVLFDFDRYDIIPGDETIDSPPGIHRRGRVGHRHRA